MLKKIAHGGLLAIACVGFSVHAANIEGDLIGINSESPTVGTVANTLASAFINYPGSDFFDIPQNPTFHVLVTPARIEVTYLQPVSYDSLVYHGLVFVDGSQSFPGVYALDATYTTANLTNLSYSTAGSQFRINLAGVSFGTNDKLAFNFQDAPVLPAVPEPESYAMLMGGLGLLAAMARRGRNRRLPAINSAAA